MKTLLLACEGWNAKDVSKDNVTEPERDVLVKRLEEAVAALGEHFEAVQVHVSTWDETGTWTISRGYGNWNTRQGMARAFVSRNAANEQAESIAHALKE